ncbi:MAG: hypothetical protein ABDH20_07035, partial [Thermus sp.]
TILRTSHGSGRQGQAGAGVFDVLLYRPLAHLLVLLLYPTPLKPHHLVLFHTGLALFAAGGFLPWRGRTSGWPSFSS